MSRRRDEAAWQRREDAVRAIVGGATIGETAALLGVDRSTVGKWLTEPDVRALLETERRTVAEHARDQLLAVHTEAARIILRELRGADLSTALQVLKTTVAAVTRLSEAVAGPQEGQGETQHDDTVDVLERIVSSVEGHPEAAAKLALALVGGDDEGDAG